MSYHYASFASLVAYINQANGTSFTVDDFDKKTPEVSTGDKNTALRLIAKTASAYKGRVTIEYDRLDLASLAHLTGFRVIGREPVTVHDLLPAIKAVNGIDFGTDDLEDTALVDDNGTLKAVLSAKPGSIGWIGSLEVSVDQSSELMTDAIPETSLTGLNYPSTSDLDTYAQVYLYGYDFTDHYDTIATLPTGTLSTEDIDLLVPILQAVDVSTGKTLWNGSAGNNEWSLSGAVVLSNGANDPDTLPTNPAYSYVLAIQLRAGVTIPVGTLYLHYNEPFDPNVWI